LAAFVTSPPILAQSVGTPASLLAAQVPNGDDDAAPDPDLPAGIQGQLDKTTYLRLRDEHVGLLRGRSPDALIDPSMRSAAVRQMEESERDAAITRAVVTAWTNIGPAPLPNGQTQQYPTPGAMSGRATAVAVDPTSSSIAYIGTAQGGVWRTTNGGASWTPIFDTAQSLSIGALAIAPSDHTKLYVGTGEPSLSCDSFFGVGVYRVDSANTTPVLVGPINPQVTTGSGGGAVTYNCFTGRSISKILVHPTDPATIFVATQLGFGGEKCTSLTNFVPPLAFLGLFRSSNATNAANAVTFSKLIVTTEGSFDSPPTGNRGISDMVLEPGNASNLLVALTGSSTASGIYRSTNALVATPAFSHTLTPGVSFITQHLAIAKVSTTVTAYATSDETSGNATCASQGEAGRVRKSTDGGATWSTPLAAAEGFCGGQCYYDSPIAVDPGNASLVYLGGNARSGFDVTGCSDVLKRSTDGGGTFTRDDGGLHADSHGFAVDALTNPVTIWFVTDGGVWKRQDAAAGTAWLNENNSPLSTIQYQSVAVHPTSTAFTIGGTQDNGTQAQPSVSGTWTLAATGDGGYTLIDQSATDTTTHLKAMYHTFYNYPGNQIGFERTELGSCLSTVDSWEYRGYRAFNQTIMSAACDTTQKAAANGIGSADAVNFYAPMALGPGTPNTVYFGTDRLYRSSDRGDTMSAVSQGPIVSTIPISSIGISPSSDSIRIVGLNNGKVYGTTTGSSTLTDFAFSAPANADTTTNKFVSRVVVDPNNANTAYVALSYYTSPSSAGQIWKTTNFNLGTPTWAAASGGLPNIPVDALVADPMCNGHLWAGTDIGVYETVDGGTTWNAYGTGLPRVAVFDLALQNSSRTLRAATHGRGMWEAAAHVCQLRGDANGSGGRDISDVFYMINALFASGPTPPNQCAGDADHNGTFNIADVFFMINFFFASGPAPAAC
jgi:hypothetical protein